MEKKVLTLSVKKEWFDKIVSGEKTEEYREIKPYWASRLVNQKAGSGEVCLRGGWWLYCHNRRIGIQTIHSRPLHQWLPQG